MNRKVKKLSLHRETLRNLNPEAQIQVEGGATVTIFVATRIICPTPTRILCTTNCPSLGGLCISLNGLCLLIPGAIMPQTPTDSYCA